MLRSTRLQAVVLLTLGVVLGYAAASGHVRLDWFATAAGPSAKAADPQTTGGECPLCCQGGVDKRQELTRLETHNQEVAAKAAQAG